MFSDERGQTEAAGTVLVVGLTVVLAAFFGFVVFQEYGTDQPAPSVGFDYDYDRNAERLAISHAGGPSIPGEELYVVVRGGDGTVTAARNWGEFGTVSAGDTLVFEGVEPRSTATIVWQQDPGGPTYVVGEWRGPAA